MIDFKKYIFVKDDVIVDTLMVDYAQEREPALKARDYRNINYPGAKIFVQCFTLKGADYDD